jgi:hypothetical protein
VSEDASGRGAGGNGDAADGGPAGGPGAGGDEAAWQDLVARYDLPADPAGAAPWPDRESLTPPDRDPGPAGPDRDPGPAGHPPGPGGDRERVIRPAVPPSVPAPASARPAGGSDADDASRSDDADDEHYIPPPPPPLPHLDPIAKGAWTAMFGGPAYLLLTSFLGWTVPGWAALLAVMAFVGGFAVVVLRLGDGPSRGAGPDNGAML